jgi:hypothetical protein
MTLFQIFMALLYHLQHAQETCYAEYIQSGTPYIAYGGNCMQAFVWTLVDRTLTFVLP